MSALAAVLGPDGRGGEGRAVEGRVADAYARCAAITGEQARNFSYGIRLLPPAKRQAMSALYAFARRVDDVGDGALSGGEKLEALAGLRRQVDAAVAGDPAEDDPVLLALADALRRFAIPPEALGELIAGCEMDCRQQRYETFEELVVYCRCVAGTIGRCSLGIFGSDDPEAPRLADTLGIALQLTNILRDVVEDRDVMGRVYLPAEDLVRFGCSEDVRGSREALAELVRFETGRAEAAYGDGLALLGMLDRRSRACVAAMAGIYHRLLARIEADPLRVFGERVSLPATEKAWVAARSLAGAGV